MSSNMSFRGSWKQTGIVNFTRLHTANMACIYFCTGHPPLPTYVKSKFKVENVDASAEILVFNDSNCLNKRCVSSLWLSPQTGTYIVATKYPLAGLMLTSDSSSSKIDSNK